MSCVSTAMNPAISLDSVASLAVDLEIHVEGVMDMDILKM